MASLKSYLFPKFTGRIPERLFWELKRGKCVLFAGAGLSSQVTRIGGKPLPAWGELLRELAGLARKNGYPVANDLLQTVDRGQLLEAAQELQNLIDPSSLETYLASIFADPGVLPTPAHLTLPEMRLRAILTTNYDTLIEDSYRAAMGQAPITLTYKSYVSRHRDPIRNNDFFVYKIHGDYRDLSTIVLGTRSYQDLIHWNPGYRFLLESIFNAYTVLFVGFGGSDPDVNHALDALATRLRDHHAAHYILLPENRWTETAMRRAKEDRGLEVIEYDASGNHIQVGAFLGELARGRPAWEGKLHVVVVVHRADQHTVPSLWPALQSASQLMVTTVDLGGADQAGWFDDLRAYIELCDVVIPVISDNYSGEGTLVESISTSTKTKTIPLLVNATPKPTLLPHGVTMLATADDLWLELLMKQLEETRLNIEMGK